MLEDEQLKSSVLSDRLQGQEVEVQTNFQNDEEDAKTTKTAVITKSLSLDHWENSQEDGDKSNFSVRRSKTLPGRIKTPPLDLPEDKMGR